MSKPKAVLAAEARVAELEAAIATRNAAEQAAQQAIAPAIARKAMLSRRLSKMLLLTEAGGSPYSEAGGIRLRSLDNVTLGWHNVERKPADLAEALLAGEVKIEAIGGIAYTLRGFLRRSRMTTLAQLWAVRRAVAKRERAEGALKAAWKAEREAYAEAFGIGAKCDEAVIASQVAAKLAISARPASIDPAIYEAGRSATNELANAQNHLAWAKGTDPDKGLCQCYACQGDRRTAANARIEAERIAGLPTGMISCPQCNRRHRVSLDERATTFTEDKAAELHEKFGVTVKPYERVTVPRGFCHKSESWILLASEWAVRQAKAAKAAARHKSKGLTFICPNPDCGCTVTSVIEGDMVSCDECEAEWDAGAVKTVKPEKAAA